MNTAVNAAGPSQTNNNEVSDCQCAPCRCRPTPRGQQVGGWICLIVAVLWIMGAVIAKGFWSTLFAICVPPWGWYLVVEKFMLICLGAAWLQ